MRQNPYRTLILASGFIGLILITGLFLAWYWLGGRPQPSEQSQELYPGVYYSRQVRQSPRPMVIHVVQVDLREEGISLLVTPGDPKAGLPLAARTTSEFLEEFNLQLAVNGDGFLPWRSNAPLDIYPRSGDGVDPIGLAASEGVQYSSFTDNEPVLYLGRNNRAQFNSPGGKVYNAISGNLMLVARGKALPGLEGEPEPRTALALDRRGRTLLIVVVDGRQPGYSEGATLNELAELVVEFGGYQGMNMDGGGSSTLVR
ncbi:MAG TPA: phosphodiester glycosidase family protein, partial [Anaerolineales bacterium]|nr:phosphodiester glycosidase family protein [Anaerolineales bacterium]